MRRIALDAMGGDNAPGAIVKGGLDALKKYDFNLILVGDQVVLEALLKLEDYDKSRLSIVHTTQVIEAEDTPTDAIKNKKDASMMVGLKLVKQKEAEAFVSAGNTGALLAGATVTVGRIKGIDRPAIATFLPNTKSFTFLIDSGANAEIKPHYLVQFGWMGSIYMEHIVGIKNPSVGLVNIGSEKGKGTEIVKSAYTLLEASGLHFIGNVEGDEITLGKADIIVCDGFTGNIILKYAEGLSKGLFSIIKKEITADFKSKMAAALLKPAFKRVMAKTDASEYGGAPLLGLNGLVVKAHGSSNSIAIENAVKQCMTFIEKDIVNKITEKLIENQAQN